MLGSTALNALDRPRTVDLPIIKALHSDGLGFFLVRRPSPLPAPVARRSSEC